MERRDLLTLNEAAAELGLSIPSIYARLEDGRLKRYQPGGPRTRVWVTRKSVDTYKAGEAVAAEARAEGGAA